MKKPKDPFTARYPTARARDVADAVFDRLSLSTTIGECIRQWELTYLEANGRVKS